MSKERNDWLKERLNELAVGIKEATAASHVSANSAAAAHTAASGAKELIKTHVNAVDCPLAEKSTRGHENNVKFHPVLSWYKVGATVLLVVSIIGGTLAILHALGKL